MSVPAQRDWEVSGRENQSTEQIRRLFARYRDMARGIGVAVDVEPAQAETQPAPGSPNGMNVASAGRSAGVQRMRSLTRPKYERAAARAWREAGEGGRDPELGLDGGRRVGRLDRPALVLQPPEHLCRARRAVAGQPCDHRRRAVGRRPHAPRRHGHDEHRQTGSGSRILGHGALATSSAMDTIVVTQASRERNRCPASSSRN
jgi:hypothetical protein